MGKRNLIDKKFIINDIILCEIFNINLLLIVYDLNNRNVKIFLCWSRVGKLYRLDWKVNFGIYYVINKGIMNDCFGKCIVRLLDS